MVFLFGAKPDLTPAALTLGDGGAVCLQHTIRLNELSVKISDNVPSPRLVRRYNAIAAILNPESLSL
jgi:hypothetical protein